MWKISMFGENHGLKPVNQRLVVAVHCFYSKIKNFLISIFEHPSSRSILNSKQV